MGQNKIDAELALTIVGAMTDTILIINSMGRIEFIASGDSQFVLGQRPDYWLGQSAFDLIHPEDLDGVRDRVKAALRNQALRGDYLRLRLGTGAAPWLAAEAHGFTPITYEGGPCVLVSVRDDAGQLAVERAKFAARRTLQAAPGQDGQIDNRSELLEEILPWMFGTSVNNDCFAILCVKAINYQACAKSSGTDLALQAMSHVSGQLVRALRDCDLVARVTNDEMLVACPEVETARHAQLLADRMLLAANASISDLKLTVGYALGSKGDDFAMLVDHGRAGAGGLVDLASVVPRPEEKRYTTSPA